MKKVMNKLRSSRGETLVESMAAILIFTLASILFLSMVNAASTTNLAVRQEEERVQATVNAAESGEGLGEERTTASIQVFKEEDTEKAHPLLTVSVDNIAIAGDRNGLYAYYYAP